MAPVVVAGGEGLLHVGRYLGSGERLQIRHRHPRLLVEVLDEPLEHAQLFTDVVGCHRVSVTAVAGRPGNPQLVFGGGRNVKPAGYGLTIGTSRMYLIWSVVACAATCLEIIRIRREPVDCRRIVAIDDQ